MWSPGLISCLSTLLEIRPISHSHSETRHCHRNTVPSFSRCSIAEQKECNFSYYIGLGPTLILIIQQQEYYFIVVLKINRKPNVIMCGIGMCVAINGNLLINYSHPIQMQTFVKGLFCGTYR